ncbi:hypothetical protein EVAR_72240_1, partial [Eumeta japonica]
MITRKGKQEKDRRRERVEKEERERQAGFSHPLPLTKETSAPKLTVDSSVKSLKISPAESLHGSPPMFDKNQGDVTQSPPLPCHGNFYRSRCK